MFAFNQCKLGPHHKTESTTNAPHPSALLSPFVSIRASPGSAIGNHGLVWHLDSLELQMVWLHPCVSEFSGLSLLPFDPSCFV